MFNPVTRVIQPPGTDLLHSKADENVQPARHSTRRLSIVHSCLPPCTDLKVPSQGNDLSHHRPKLNSEPAVRIL